MSPNDVVELGDAAAMSGVRLGAYFGPAGTESDRGTWAFRPSVHLCDLVLYARCPADVPV